jgi:hypothetical protein
MSTLSLANRKEKGESDENLRPELSNNVSIGKCSVYHLKSIPLTIVLHLVSNNVIISAETTASQPSADAEDKNTFGSPHDPTTMNEPQSIEATGDPAGFNNSAMMDAQDALGISGKTGGVGIKNAHCHGDDTNDHDSEGVDVNNTQVCHGDNTNDAEMSAPQPSTSVMETPAPDWLKRMLVYLRGVSDTLEWQDLVSELLRFENLSPPSGVRFFSLNYHVLSNLTCLTF